MIPITETDDLYPTTVPLLEVTDPVLGGPSGPSNAAAIALANRTRYLKAALDALGPGSTMGAENVGTGVGLYLGTEGGMLQLLTLLEGANITLTPLPGGLRIDAVAGSGESSSNFANVINFGAVADFVPGPGSTGTGTDNSTAFNDAMASGLMLWIPAGHFYISNPATRAEFSKILSFGPGEVWGDTNVGKTRIGKTLVVGTNRSHEAGAVGGLLLGAESGGNGIRQWMGHHNWMQWEPTKAGAPTQVQVYNNANLVSARCTSPNILTAVYGEFPIARMAVGDHVGFNGALYKITELTSSASIKVSNFDGSPAALVTDATARFFGHAYETSTGTCNTSGTTVTYVSGEQFPYGYSGDHMYAIINGVRYTVTQGPETTNANTLTLSSSAGVQTDATIEFRRCYGPFAYVSLIRLQGLEGGVETTAGLCINIRGECILFSGATQNGLEGPMRINAIRTRIGANEGLEPLEAGPDYVSMGGVKGKESLRALAIANAINRLEARGGPTGFAPALCSRGGDSNPDMQFDLQGYGTFRFTAGSLSRTVMEVYAPLGTTAWPTLAAGDGRATLSANSFSSDADLEIKPKGTAGKVIIAAGQWLYFSLQNGWSDGVWGVPTGFRLDVGSRIVRLRGMLASGSSGTLIGYLPVGYRPPNTIFLSGLGGGLTPAGIQIFADGRVFGFGSGSPVYQITLDGLTYALD